MRDSTHRLKAWSSGQEVRGVTKTLDLRSLDLRSLPRVLRLMATSTWGEKGGGTVSPLNLNPINPSWELLMT